MGTNEMEMLSGYLNLSKPLLFCLTCDMSTKDDNENEFSISQSKNGSTEITLAPRYVPRRSHNVKNTDLKLNMITKHKGISIINTSNNSMQRKLVKSIDTNFVKSKKLRMLDAHSESYAFRSK